MVDRLSERESVTRLPRRNAADPAALYRTAQGITFGIIASDTEPFCADCNRLRLTAKGLLRGCLYQSGGAALGPALKAGADDVALTSMIRLAQSSKRSFHPLTHAERVPFSMADAGG
jgi:cyclic pyranopterin phosphate synthase